MSPSSHCESCEEVHQSGLGSLIRKVLLALRPQGKRSRPFVRDLPAGLRHDIGLEIEPDPDTFEGRWQEELRSMRR